jgi:hypothetical protein
MVSRGPELRPRVPGASELPGGGAGSPKDEAGEEAEGAPEEGRGGEGAGGAGGADGAADGDGGAAESGGAEEAGASGEAGDGGPDGGEAQRGVRKNKLRSFAKGVANMLGLRRRSKGGAHGAGGEEPETTAPAFAAELEGEQSA